MTPAWKWHTKFQNISMRIFENKKACHMYVFDCRSRASYKVLWTTKLGMIWNMSWMTTKRNTKIANI